MIVNFLAEKFDASGLNFRSRRWRSSGVPIWIEVESVRRDRSNDKWRVLTDGCKKRQVHVAEMFWLYSSQKEAFW
jgi:hypothetical protein